MPRVSVDRLAVEALNGCCAVFQRGRPDAFEQIAHRRHLTRRLGDQLFAADTQVPQPGPNLIDRFGFRSSATAQAAER